MSNEELIEHPMTQQPFMTRGMRASNADTSISDFKDVHLPADKQADARFDDEWPVRIEEFNNPEYWGFPIDAGLRVYCVVVWHYSCISSRSGGLL